MSKNEDTGSTDEVAGDVQQAVPIHAEELPLDQREMALLRYSRLPLPVKRRVRCLKKLQMTFFQKEAEFFKKMHEIEREYHERFAILHKKRQDIADGVYEPTDEECDWKSDSEEEEEEGGEEAVPSPDSTVSPPVSADVVASPLKVDYKDETKEDSPATVVPPSGDVNPQVKKTEEATEADAASTVKGIPLFWYTVLKNAPLTSEMIQEHDDPILKHLIQITLSLNVPKPAPYDGFVLDFHFSDNEYFTNKVLQKIYYIRADPPKADPLSYEGPEIVEAKGCTINWQPGKNVTITTVKKTVKKKKVTKVVKQLSFFNFFGPPTNSLDLDKGEELDEEVEMTLHHDFEIGQFLRERAMPRAVLYFTGDAIDEDDMDDLDEDDDDSDDDDDDDDALEGQNKPNECASQ